MSEHKLKTMPELGRMNPDEFKVAEKFPFAVVLDNVRSMHNIGSCFRTCDAFRVQKLYLCGFTAVPPHREIEKAALGATLSVEWEHADDTCEAVRRLQASGYKVFAVEQVHGSIPLQEFEISGVQTSRSAEYGVQTSRSAEYGVQTSRSAKYGVQTSRSAKFKEADREVRTPGTTSREVRTPCAFVFGNEVEGVQQSVVDLCDGALEIPQFGTKHSFNVSVSIGIVLWQAYRNFL